MIFQVSLHKDQPKRVPLGICPNLLFGLQLLQTSPSQRDSFRLPANSRPVGKPVPTPNAFSPRRLPFPPLSLQKHPPPLSLLVLQSSYSPNTPFSHNTSLASCNPAPTPKILSQTHPVSPFPSTLVTTLPGHQGLGPPSVRS